MPDYKIDSHLGANARVDRPMSRIHSQVETVKMLSERTRAATERVIQHAHSLGFFNNETTAGNGAVPPTPVISSMDDAIRELDRSLDMLAAALNLFD